LDGIFQDWAKDLAATEYYFPPFLSAAQMARLDYFKSFPHLITIPVVLKDEKANLQTFADAPFQDSRTGARSSLNLTELQAPAQVLTPAACYHFYDELEGQDFDESKFLTTRCVCYRNENKYLPLQRQWAFNMREIVCISSMEKVQAYLEQFEKLLSDYFAEHKFPVKFEYATDPFFNPASNPKYLLQKLEPVKKEMIYDDHLSIGSLNFHRNFFGETFEIKHGGKPAFTACVAFGLERWVYMILKEQGIREKDWSF
ncbi:MAG: hypothetical protein K2Z81_18020, partial [Cyanobacteria bacterium]|nr:hypothetical protein [Cyanobacteriota bacterium]